jgi:hypothetical protein
MPFRILFTVAIISVSNPAFAWWGSAPAEELTISSENLFVGCDFGDRKLIVRSNGAEIYGTSSYGSDRECLVDRDRLQVLFNAARITHNKIKFKANDNPPKDFSVAVEAGGKLAISPKNLSADCRGADSNILVVASSSEVVYASSQYGNQRTCAEDAKALQLKINGARATDKLISFKHTDSASSDFDISNSPDPLGRRSSQESNTEENGTSEDSFSAT